MFEAQEAKISEDNASSSVEIPTIGLPTVALHNMTLAMQTVALETHVFQFLILSLIWD